MTLYVILPLYVLSQGQEVLTSGHRPSLISPMSLRPSTSLLSATNLRALMIESSMEFSPSFGYTAPAHDFSEYNRTRSNSDVREWQYPRSRLVYHRELGEGQFGKVLLMKAQV